MNSSHKKVRPENVLVVSNGSKKLSDWHFKFADYGLRNDESKVLKDGGSAGNDMQDANSYGKYK
jgi:hypothetical protein